MMTLSESGLNLIKSFEDLRLEAYLDEGGVPTIGYGHTAWVQMGDTCDIARADEWLRKDVGDAEREVCSLILAPLTQYQFDALVSWTFNLGGGNLYQSTLRKKLQAGDYAGAAEEIPKWNHVGGQIVLGLTIRRLVERQVFLGQSVPAYRKEP